MKKRLHSIVVLFLILALAATAFAQKKDYKAGEKIEYKVEGSSPEKWEMGTFGEPSYDGSQPIIRQKPDKWFKDGFQTAAKWENIRPLGTRTAGMPLKSKSGNAASEVKPTLKTVVTRGKGVMTKEEIFDFLRIRLPQAPDDPNAEKVSKELIEEIKRRGVKYFKVGPNDINNRFVRYSPTYDIVFAIEHNYDAPKPQQWLMGTWNLMVIGGTVDTARGDGYIYRENERAARAGFLTINKNGTYRWKPGPNDAVISGRWRKATAEEMWVQGGAGVVLIKGEGGDDWIARKSVNRSFKGERLDIALLDMRYRGGKRRIGARQ